MTRARSAKRKRDSAKPPDQPEGNAATPPAQESASPTPEYKARLEGSIDFSKYTTAIAAGAMLYTIEKQLPQTMLFARLLVLGILILLLAASLTGIYILAASTTGQYGLQERAERLKIKIAKVAPWHGAFLGAGILLLSGVIVYKVFAVAPSPPEVRCVLVESTQPSTTIPKLPAAPPPAAIVTPQTEPEPQSGRPPR